MRRAAAAAALPALVGAVLVALGHPIGWVAIVAAGLRAQIALVLPEVDAALDRGMQRGLDAFRRGLTAVLLAPAALLVVLAGAIGRLLRRDAIQRSAGWSSVAAAGGRAEAHARPRALRAGALVTAMVLVAIGAWAWQRERGPDAATTDDLPLAAALVDQPDIGEVQREEGEVFSRYEEDPEVGWRLPAAFDGSVVGVEQGRRRTVQATDEGPLVWLFGGSAAFGSNQRDDRTIASRLAAISTAAGAPVRVVNWGRHAFTAYQEAELLAQALATDAERPDLVVFYDGYNDVAVGLGASFLDAPSSVPPRAPSIVAGAEPKRPSGPPTWRTPEARYDAVVATYARAAALARSVAAPLGIEVVQVWQPSAFTRPLTPGERSQLARLGLADDAIATFERAHEAIRERLPDDVIDLADALDDAPSVFVDHVHTNELGADLVAQQLSDALLPRVRALAD